MLNQRERDIKNILTLYVFTSFAVIERELVSNTVDGTSAPIEEPIPTLSWPPEAFDNTSGEEDSLLSIGAASISMMNKSGESRDLRRDCAAPNAPGIPPRHPDDDYLFILTSVCLV